MVALSFVRSAKDVDVVHQVMDEEGRRVPVIAKIEKPQAVENLDEIVDAFDAFMVARGDLGVELPLEEVPLVQKQIVTAARRWAKPVIVATQMLESMISAAAADPGRGLRRRQRDPRRRRRGHAVRRDQRRGAIRWSPSRRWPGSCVNTEQHGLGPDAGHRLGPAHHQRRDHQGGRRGRAADRREVPGHLHPLRRLGPAAGPAAVADPDPRLHPDRADPGRAHPELGAWRRSWCRWSGTPTT